MSVDLPPLKKGKRNYEIASTVDRDEIYGLKDRVPLPAGLFFWYGPLASLLTPYYYIVQLLIPRVKSWRSQPGTFWQLKIHSWKVGAGPVYSQLPLCQLSPGSEFIIYVLSQGK